MRLVAILAVAVALAGAPVRAEEGHRPIDHYAFYNAHREDVGALPPGVSVYSDTHTTCESAVLTTLIMAHDDGWDVAIDPPFRAVVSAFPSTSPCSATLALR